MTDFPTPQQLEARQAKEDTIEYEGLIERVAKTLTKDYEVGGSVYLDVSNVKTRVVKRVVEFLWKRGWRAEYQAATNLNDPALVISKGMGLRDED